MMTRKLWAVLDKAGTLAVIVASGVFLWSYMTTPTPPGPRPSVDSVEDVSGTLDIAAAQTLGSGPLVLVEFGDYQCPFCRRFALESFPQLRAQFIDTGRMRYAAMHMPLPIHANARVRAAVAHCAGPRVWDIREALYDGPPDLEALGVDQACVDSDLTRTVVDEHIEQAKGFGVEGTPTFLLGTARADGKVDVTKRLRGALPLEQFVSELSLLEGRLE